MHRTGALPGWVSGYRNGNGRSAGGVPARPSCVISTARPLSFRVGSGSWLDVLCVELSQVTIGVGRSPEVLVGAER
jgi:hypothetical protein